jgi:hypothetical protein
MSTGNLWLAVGDETGAFSDPQSSSLHGVGLILARPSALAAALNETFNAETIRHRMTRPIEGLSNWLIAKGPEKSKELTRHHVREAWNYFNDPKQAITGQYALDASHSDPVLTNLLAAFRWLATHQGILSLGIYGTGKEVLTDFWKGSDPMAAIGALYGRTLALVRPFLGPSARIRMYPGRRSEEINAASILRAGQNVPAPLPGMSRQTTSKTGGNRALLEAMESEFWKALSAMGDHLPVPSQPSTRQITFAPYMDRKVLASALDKEDKVAANLIRNEENVLNSLADLACSLMVAGCDTTERKLRIAFPDPIGPNVRFFSVREVL